MASKARRRTSVCLTSIVLGIATILASSEGVNGQQDGYYGKYIGKLKTLHHGVTGEVFAVDARTLHIRDFSYDGEGPAAFFYAGSSKTPSPSGFRINDEKGLTQPLQRYHNKHVTITLPDGKTLNNIKWFSVWCDEFAVNFGDVKIPKNLDYPRPQKIDPLNGVHLVSSNPIVIVDAQTLLIPNFSYDGEAPDAKFWVGRGNKPSPQGIRVPDENGKENPLRRYDHKNIVLTLPGDLTVFDIGHFGVWCEAFTVDFGHVRIPRGLNVPPSLKMLGVSPQKRPRSLELLAQQTQYQQLLYNPEQQLAQQHTFGEGVGFRRNIDSSSPFSQTGFTDNNRNNNFHDNNNKPFSPLFHAQSSFHLSGSPNYDTRAENRQQQIRATTYKPTFDLQKLQHQQRQQYEQQYYQQQQQQPQYQQQLNQQLHQQQLHQQQLNQQLHQQQIHQQQRNHQQHNQNAPLTQTDRNRDYDTASSIEIVPSVILHEDTRTVRQQTPNFQQRYLGGQQQFQQQFSSSTNLQQQVQINKSGYSNRQFGITSEHHQGFHHPNQVFARRNDIFTGTRGPFSASPVHNIGENIGGQLYNHQGFHNQRESRFHPL